MKPFRKQPLIFANRPLTWLILGFLCLLLTFTFVVFRLGDWLTPSDPLPGSLDLIVTFAGENVRVEYSKELMSRYPEAHWLLSDYKNGYGRILQKNNYDMQRVTVVDTCKNTLSEINAAAAWISDSNRNSVAGNEAKRRLSVGLVSSPYHMRRIDLMARRYLSRLGIRYALLPVPLKKYQWGEKTFRYWWRSQLITSITMLELIKIGYFLLTGFT
jgi:uncharacterized SAM-binding protein YcdF (DUF218 family)